MKLVELSTMLSHLWEHHLNETKGLILLLSS